MDNNQRAVFLRAGQRDTRWNQQRLQNSLSEFEHHELDIRDRPGVERVVREIRSDLIVHSITDRSIDISVTRGALGRLGEVITGKAQLSPIASEGWRDGTSE